MMVLALVMGVAAFLASKILERVFYGSKLRQDARHLVELDARAVDVTHARLSVVWAERQYAEKLAGMPEHLRMEAMRRGLAILGTPSLLMEMPASEPARAPCTQPPSEAPPPASAPRERTMASMVWVGGELVPARRQNGAA